MQKNFIIIVVALLVVGAGSFYGGMKYGQSKNNVAQNFQNRQFRTGANGQGPAQRQGRTNGGGIASGEIIKKDDTSITIKFADGGSKTIYLTDKTSIAKSTDGTKDDLAIGKNVMANGTANQDGSIAAQNIQIRPEGAASFGGNRPQQPTQQPQQQ